MVCPQSRARVECRRTGHLHQPVWSTIWGAGLSADTKLSDVIAAAGADHLAGRMLESPAYLGLQPLMRLARLLTIIQQLHLGESK